MSLAKYKILISVVEQGSLTRAAAALGCTQSAVSHSINSLEEELGFALIKRGKGGVRLTNEGERLMPAVRNLLSSAEQLSQTPSAGWTQAQCASALLPPWVSTGCHLYSSSFSRTTPRWISSF